MFGFSGIFEENSLNCGLIVDFSQRYATYIISVMAKLCAPVRDEKIKELGEITDVVDTFKNILEVTQNTYRTQNIYIAYKTYITHTKHTFHAHIHKN